MWEFLLTTVVLLPPCSVPCNGLSAPASTANVAAVRGTASRPPWDSGVEEGQDSDQLNVSRGPARANLSSVDLNISWRRRPPDQRLQASLVNQARLDAGSQCPAIEEARTARANQGRKPRASRRAVLETFERVQHEAKQAAGTQYLMSKYMFSQNTLIGTMPLHHNM